MRSDCPISYALDFFGDKWTFLIIRDMVFDQKRFYRDFLSSKEGMATNILSDRLKRLEEIGIVKSRVFEEKKTMKEYKLTQKGMDLIPVLLETIAWSAKHQKGLNIPENFLKKMKKNREKLISKVENQLLD